MTVTLTIQQRLLGLCLLSVTFVVVVGMVGLVSSHRMNQTSGHMALTTSALRLQMHSDMMHDAVRGDVMEAMVTGLHGDVAKKDSLKAEFNAHAQEFEQAMQGLQAMSLDANVMQALEGVRPLLVSYLATSRQMMDAALNRPEAAAALMPQFHHDYVGLEDRMAALGEMLEQGGLADHADNNAAAEQARWLIATSTLLAATLGWILGQTLSRSILTPIGEAIAVARRVASGDLTSRIDVRSRDELGQLMSALRDMNQQLATLVGEVRAAGESMATGAAEISLGNADLSQRTETQASSLQQTAASMAQLTSSVNHNADAAQHANQLARRAREVAAEGGGLVEEVIGTMTQISASSHKISDIIAVIDGIAFQTNILALNAAVEAARAGEQGRGFAVVASEVRTLAQRSGEAAREIRQLIHDSVDKVDTGAGQVSKAGQTMGDIVTQVKRVSELIEEITSSTQEQSTGIAQVSSAVGQLDGVTQQNAALVEQSAAAAESLRIQSAKLMTSVQAFRLSDVV